MGKKINEEDVLPFARLVQDWLKVSNNPGSQRLEGHFDENLVSLSAEDPLNDRYFFGKYVVMVTGDIIGNANFYVFSVNGEDKFAAELYEEANDLYRYASRKAEINEKIRKIISSSQTKI